MSTTGLSSHPNKNSFHWRNNSGELDVFEAARYFSGANENPGYSDFIDRPQGQRAAARMSLDLPIMMNPINSDSLPTDQKQPKENKKYKQPSSPGGRLASFLNSLFNQTTSRKKKKPKSGQKDLDQEERPGGGRKRRSSISHFRITTSSAANVDSNSSSGFNSANTPTKSYKELRYLSDHQKANFSVPENLGNAEKTSTDCGRMDEKFRFSNGNISRNVLSSNRISSARNWADNEEIREFRKFSDVDDGADSDSSSDLFDLPNHDLDFYSNGLPVYGTTHIDRLRIGAPVS
ncbi:UNVERIFIED_CONTAM: protein BIG GRAIN 1-like E [Sesamum radiatum]|uniref:Protein BIG GRAIN 1-like E n=1 Tax=Sesamum radiatum TaxID=300843 RepID=A0AAW2VLB0_SESRA